jgi:RimJ/RimL family protein N-acetyltransferase
MEVEAMNEAKVAGRWELATSRLRLPRLVPGDGEHLHRYRSDPNVRRFQSLCPESVEAAEEFVAQQLHVEFGTKGTWAQIGVELSEEKMLIGDFGVHFLEEEERQVELGFTIAPSFQRRGYAREAMMALLGHLFEECKKHRVVLRMDAGNAAALALASSLGFRKEGLFVKSFWADDHWADKVVCAMLHSEWGQ